MKKIISLVLIFASLSAAAQGPISKITDRFSDPEKGSPVFIEKGYRALGISGGYKSFGVGGDSVADGDGYSILSILNIGNGKLNTYSVTPSFSYFVADDVSLGVRLDYDGYFLSSDLSLFGFEILDWQLNNHSWSASITARKYMSFFGSKTIGLFGEGRLYGKYGFSDSTPYRENTADEITGALPRPDLPADARYLATDEARHTDRYGVGLKIAAGVAVKLKDNSALSVSIPIIGAGYSYNHQTNYKNGNKSHTSKFDISRDIDFLAIQVGYTHYIKSKK